MTELKVEDVTPPIYNELDFTAEKITVFKDYLLVGDPSANSNRGAIWLFKDDKLIATYTSEFYRVGEFVWLGEDSELSPYEEQVVLLTTHRDSLTDEDLSIDALKLINNTAGAEGRHLQEHDHHDHDHDHSIPLSENQSYSLHMYMAHLVLVENERQAKSTQFRSGRLYYSDYDKQIDGTFVK